MSRIRIYGDSTGYVEIKAPDVAGNTTVEIPEGSFVGKTEFDEKIEDLEAIAILGL
jgi:hypothetical protein